MQVLLFALIAGICAIAQTWAVAQLPGIEIPLDLTPEGSNVPAAVDLSLDHYDENGFPEDPNGLIISRTEPSGYMVYLETIADPFLLYAQFVNPQRDGVFLARSAAIKDPLPNGEMVVIPHGHGALKTSTSYVSLVEGVLVPHISDNQKEYGRFVIRDLYLAIAVGMSGLITEIQYAHAEHIFGYAKMGINLLGGVGENRMAPLNYYRVPVPIGAGLRHTSPWEPIIGENHWEVGGELLLGFRDADQNPQTPSPVWLPGLFFEIEKREERIEQNEPNN